MRLKKTLSLLATLLVLSVTTIGLGAQGYSNTGVNPVTKTVAFTVASISSAYRAIS